MAESLRHCFRNNATLKYRFSHISIKQHSDVGVVKVNERSKNRPKFAFYSNLINGDSRHVARVLETTRQEIWRAREREPIWGSGGFAPSGVQGQSPWSGGLGGSPLKLTRFCRYKTEFVS